MANNVTIDTFNEAATACLSAFAKAGKVQDQIFNGDPLFAFLNAKNRKESVGGGEYIKVNLRRGKNTTAGSYAGWDPLSMTPQQTVGFAQFPWAQYAASVVIDEATVLKNRGDKAIFSLVADKTQEVVDSLQDLMTVDLYGDGTGNSGKDLLGLGAINSATGILAGINRATAGNEFWQAKVDGTTGNNKVIDLAMLGHTINTVRGPGGDPQKQGKCDLILTTQEIYETIESLYTAKVQVPTSDLTLGKLGFEALKYKGAEITWSPNVATGDIHFLSSAALGLRVMEGRDFKFTPFESTLVNGQDGRAAFLLWMGNLVTTEPRRLGKLTGVLAVAAG